MSRFFGTDGVRGRAGSELTVAMAEALGQAAVRVLGPHLLIGRDTRLSGPDLEAGLVAGISAAGGQAWLAGVVPTPAVALLLRQYGADGGIVISASHNPPEYNGIKFFNNQGFKLALDQEDQLEAALQAMPDLNTSVLDGSNSSADPVRTMTDATERYIDHACQSLLAQGFDLQGWRIVVDCAHGASYQTTPTALRRLGAEVIALNTDYDGTNINVDCGSTHLEFLQAAVPAYQADLGFAHDGDADRVIAVDAAGQEVDGDYFLAICGADLQQQGRLPHHTVVGTVMANFGLGRALAALDIRLEQTDVGDSKVLARMLDGGFLLGGEQSGHLIFLEQNSTGDGLISLLQLLAALCRRGQSLAETARLLQKYPQVLENVAVVDKPKIQNSAALAAAVESLQRQLGESGRILLRPSGTEPLFRVMVEAQDAGQAQDIARQLVALVRQIDQS
ncbi:MAG: phosphoglucosamine mutase [Actinomycetia bacterium]|nr:phosphoglucosamine mutase [Actinomycetes bacterium]